MANGADDRVFDLMESTFVEDLPLWDDKDDQVYYQIPGAEGKGEPYYKPGDKRLDRHERVIKVTDRPGEEELIVEHTSSPRQRGLIPLMPTGPKDLIAETLFSALGETHGGGAEIGAVLGFGAGVRGGKYLVGSVDQMLKGGKKGVKWADNVLGHEYSKHQYRQARHRVKEDPMYAHIPFEKVSRFEPSGSPGSRTGAGSKVDYAAYYNPGRGEDMFDELFPSGSKGWYAETNPKTGYTPSLKTEWQGGTEHMGQVSGKSKPFTFRSRPLSNRMQRGLAESHTIHEGQHYMQNYPMTPDVGWSVWDETMAGRPIYNVTKMYGPGAPGSVQYKTLINVPVPKSINNLAKKGGMENEWEEIFKGNIMGEKAGFKKQYHYGGAVSSEKPVYDMQKGGKFTDEGFKDKVDVDATWYNYSGPIEVEARLAELYNSRGVGGEMSQLKNLGYSEKEIMKMLDEYGLAKEAIYGSKPGGGWSIKEVTSDTKIKVKYDDQTGEKLAKPFYAKQVRYVFYKKSGQYDKVDKQLVEDARKYWRNK